MAEDERTIEPTGDAVSTDVTDAESDRVGDGVDDVAASFLELEADLDGTASPGATHVDGERVRGLVTDADRIDATAVPDGYPLDPTTAQILALTVDVGGIGTTAYLDWPDGSGDSPLHRLLDAMEVDLGDLYGRQVLLERTGDRYAVVTPSEPPRGSGDWVLGVAGGAVLAAGSLGVLAVTGGASLPAVLAWLGLTLGWLPYATYGDAWYLRTHSDWGGGPLFWATLSAVPGLNVFGVAAYLWTRSRATFFGDEPSLTDRAVRTVRSWL